MAENDDRRTFPRMELDTLVEMRIGRERPQPGKLVNLSTGGALVEVRDPVAPGRKNQRVDMVIEWAVPPWLGVRPERIKGRILHTGQAGRFGIVFDELRLPAHLATAAEAARRRRQRTAGVGQTCAMPLSAVCS